MALFILQYIITLTQLPSEATNHKLWVHLVIQLKGVNRVKHDLR